MKNGKTENVMKLKRNKWIDDIQGKYKIKVRNNVEVIGL